MQLLKEADERNTLSTHGRQHWTPTPFGVDNNHYSNMGFYSLAVWNFFGPARVWQK